MYVVKAGFEYRFNGNNVQLRKIEIYVLNCNKNDNISDHGENMILILLLLMTMMKIC